MHSEIVFWTFISAVICTLEASTMGDQCDWTGSGLSSGGERGVTPVYLRCREGSVSWLYPRGALRLLFKPSLPGNELDFRVCIRVMRKPDPPDLFYSHQLPNNDTAERFPARLFIEGVHRLVPLYAPDDGNPKELRCFKSRRGRAALYVEAEPEEGPTKRVATLIYEARPLERHYDPATAECRPCTDADLELAFCTSDFVARGIFVGNEHRPDLDTTQLTLKVTKLIRFNARHGIHIDLPETDTDNEYFRYETEQGGAGNGSQPLERLALVHAWAACGARAGADELVVMARRRLQRLLLVCAPRAQHWQRLVERHRADTPCRLRV